MIASAHPEGNDPLSRVFSGSSSREKVALFKQLFRGRPDVYARRFTSKKTGASGYQPACGNEWVRGVCEKPRIKCSECLHQRFLHLTDEVIRWHLMGKNERNEDFVAGVYPMLLDETCCFLAIDFDGQTWKEDANAVIEVCEGLGLQGALERSRSGNGGHLWFFFEQPVPAALARKLGAHLLTEAMEGRPEIGLKSYDRLFPNQDTLPQGGFGNLIALPLQKAARDGGNSEFVDPKAQFASCQDQWSYLASLRRIPTSKLTEVVRAAEGRGRIIGVTSALPDDEGEPQPWTLSPSRRRAALPKATLPSSLLMVLADQIYIRKGDLSPGLRNHIVRLAAFQNPEFYKAQAMRLPTYDKPRLIGCAEELQDHIGLPRGCLDECLQMCKDMGIHPEIQDERYAGMRLGLGFQGQLRDDQKKAADALINHDTGVLAATTAFGKTVVSAWLIAMRNVNTLVLVHRQQLLEQWVERLSQFLGVPSGEIGRWGGGKKKPNGRLDVALVQSLVRKGEVNDLVANYGQLIVDECHHVSARSFELVARRAKAKYVLGLSATVDRKDGHHPIVFMQCGPVRYKVDARLAAQSRPFGHQVIVRPTAFKAMGESDSDRRMEFQRLSSGLIESDIRNAMICNDVLAAVKAGKSPLVLTERTSHLEVLHSLLRPVVANVITLQGAMGKRQLQEQLERLAGIPADVDRVVLATGKFVGEGFDDPRLDALFVTMPVSWRGTVAQYAGRLHRLYEGKKDVQIYDYADLDVPMLSRMFDKRCAGYEAVGYTILLPASALPGWPPEVPLPVEDQWKSDYAASVRRLIRDGVQQPLASLFVHVARDFPQDATGVQRARSASEAFLFERLESLGETNGIFRLNHRVSIPFDSASEMELDLYCESARLAVEIDGGQHLSSEDAYRRDRRKDALLQMNGILVLRYLAVDVGKRLDMVLDGILGGLQCRAR